MAKIDTIGFRLGNPNDPEAQAKIINLSASVGTNGVNMHEDVIIVQALLKFALGKERSFQGEEFPEPCGAFIKQTAHLIKKYQRWINRQATAKVSIDGRIDPAKGGAYAFGKRKLWTIYALNDGAFGASLIHLGRTDYIEAMCERWGFLRPILGTTHLGSLGLGLE